ncbi:MAG: (2Fe-2S)-binding protein [Actinomycetota bacterium]|nr:(2Fe-2S)-binding protein [Actinomycetota bacterium]
MEPVGLAAADELLAVTVAGLPRDEHGYLLPAGAPRQVSFARVEDPEWLDAQIALQAQRWPTVDRRVLATLWWYSVSQVFLTPTVASLFVTGRALSPRPNDVELHWLPDGRVFTARSTAVLDKGNDVRTVAAAIRDSLEIAIPAVGRAGARRERPLWAIATDSLANRLLWVGRARGEVARATELAATLVELIGAPMPAPRYVDVERRPPRKGQARFVRRGSCCLVYLEQGVAKCASCPRLAALDRSAQLRAAAELG